MGGFGGTLTPDDSSTEETVILSTLIDFLINLGLGLVIGGFVVLLDGIDSRANTGESREFWSSLLAGDTGGV